MNRLSELVSLAIRIAGCDCFADAGIHKSDESAVLAVIESAVEFAGLCSSPCPLCSCTRQQQAALRLLLAAYGGMADLCDETGDTIRMATMIEAYESGLASDEGFILVGGKRCYVSG